MILAWRKQRRLRRSQGLSGSGFTMTEAILRRQTEGAIQRIRDRSGLLMSLMVLIDPASPPGPLDPAEA